MALSTLGIPTLNTAWARRGTIFHLLRAARVAERRGLLYTGRLCNDAPRGHPQPLLNVRYVALRLPVRQVLHRQSDCLGALGIRRPSSLWITLPLWGKIHCLAAPVLPAMTGSLHCRTRLPLCLPA